MALPSPEERKSNVLLTRHKPQVKAKIPNFACKLPAHRAFAPTLFLACNKCVPSPALQHAPPRGSAAERGSGREDVSQPAERLREPFFGVPRPVSLAVSSPFPPAGTSAGAAPAEASAGGKPSSGAFPCKKYGSLGLQRGSSSCRRALPRFGRQIRWLGRGCGSVPGSAGGRAARHAAGRRGRCFWRLRQFSPSSPFRLCRRCPHALAGRSGLAGSWAWQAIPARRRPRAAASKATSETPTCLHPHRREDGEKSVWQQQSGSRRPSGSG